MNFVNVFMAERLKMKPQPLTKSLYTFRICSFNSGTLIKSLFSQFFFFFVSLFFHLGEIEMKLISQLLIRV